MRKIVVQHFTKTGVNVFTETWKLKEPLTGDFKKDSKRLKKMVIRGAHNPNKKYATKNYVVTWGEGLDSNSILLENK